LPLLEGIDGVSKMSKSLGNYIGIDEKPNEMFGKIMSVSDELMFEYYNLLTDEDLEAIKKMHPKEAKLNLAEKITGQYHGSNLAKKARDYFERIFSQKELPQEAPIFKLKEKGARLIDILMNSSLIESRNEARRLIKQGGISLDGKRLDKESLIIDKEGILKVGKKRFLKLIKENS
jgi:tyrosyl-tRNA synthetase